MRNISDVSSLRQRPLAPSYAALRGSDCAVGWAQRGTLALAELGHPAAPLAWGWLVWEGGRRDRDGGRGGWMGKWVMDGCREGGREEGWMERETVW